MTHPADEQMHPIPHTLPFAFSASTGGYARLWLSNLVLSILTLGVYSAWAKVRNLKYLYGHTQVAGGRFGYHASPIAILKGRALMVGLFVLWQLSAEFSPLLQGLLGTGALLLTPWLAVQAMRFRLANTSWSGMRLHFDGETRDAYRAFFKSWFTLLLSLGLLWPLATLQKQRYLLPHSRLGQASLAITPCSGSLYLAVFGSILISFCFAALVTLLCASLLYASQLLAPPAIATWLGNAVSAFGGLIWALASLSYARLSINRVLINHTSLLFNEQYHALSWRLPAYQRMELALINTLALAFSLGLAWPWVRIRTLRTTFNQLTLQGGPDLARLYAQGQSQYDARGDELADMLALDLGW